MTYSMKKLVTFGHVLAITTAIGVVSTSAFSQPMPPPPEFVVTAEPVYYEGHAAYWYQNHWYYHDEPPALADHRRLAPVARHAYATPSHAEPPRGGDHGRR